MAEGQFDDLQKLLAQRFRKVKKDLTPTNARRQEMVGVARGFGKQAGDDARFAKKLGTQETRQYLRENAADLRQGNRAYGKRVAGQAKSVESRLRRLEKALTQEANRRSKAGTAEY